MHKCKYCKKQITNLQKFGYAAKHLWQDHIEFSLGFSNIGGGRITGNWWVWKDILNLGKGKIYFHEGCWDKDFREKESLAKAKSTLNYYLS